MVVLSKGLEGHSLRLPSGNHYCQNHYGKIAVCEEKAFFSNSTPSDLTLFQMKGNVYNNMFCF